MTPEAMKGHPLISALGKEAAAELLFLARSVKLGAGEMLWSEGDDGAFVAFIIRGEIELLKETDFTGSRFVVGIYGEGSLVGLEALCEEAKTRPAAAMARSDAEIMSISGADVISWAQSRPAQAAVLMRGLLDLASCRLAQSYRRMAAIF